MNILKKTKVSEVKKLMVTRSKQAFIEWYNTPDQPENPPAAGDHIAGEKK